MSTFVKVDRKTGKVLKYKHEAALNRVFNKPTVWLELETQDRPDFDSDNQKAVQEIRQSDLSDLSVDVDSGEKRVEAWQIVALSADEKAAVKNQKIADSDSELACIVEDVMVAIATGATLNRAAFSDAVWDQINARRSLRGEADV